MYTYNLCIKANLSTTVNAFLGSSEKNTGVVLSIYIVMKVVNTSKKLGGGKYTIVSFSTLLSLSRSLQLSITLTEC